MQEIIAQKKEMTQIFQGDKALPVSLVLAKEGLSRLKVGQKVKVRGISKGKGFQGVVKRHGHSGGPATHGHRHVLRTPGSTGGRFPQHTRKGRKLPGRTGHQKVTVPGLEIIDIDKETGIIAIKGAVPGGRHAKVAIRT